MVRTQVVPFPLSLEAAPVSSIVLRQQLEPLAEEFGVEAHICYTREPREGLLRLLSRDTLILLACHRRGWLRWWPSRPERLAHWLRRRGYHVVLEFVE
jgi:hypothetical protein